MKIRLLLLAALLIFNGQLHAATTTVNGAGAGGGTPDDPNRLRSTTVALNATNIVGNSAGDLGHAAGVELVAAVVGKRIVFDHAIVRYTFVTAAYATGTSMSVRYWDGVADVTVSENHTGIAGATSSTGIITANDTAIGGTSPSRYINESLILAAATAFTNPGTAAGTATVTTYYRLVDD